MPRGMKLTVTNQPCGLTIDSFCISRGNTACVVTRNYRLQDIQLSVDVRRGMGGGSRRVSWRARRGSPRLNRSCRRADVPAPRFESGLRVDPEVRLGFPVVIGAGSHPFPFRTRKLSLLPPMVLHG